MIGGQLMKENEFFGGAVLADDTCGSVTLYGDTGSVLRINVSDDPEYTMSGLVEPCSSFDKW